MNFFGYVGHVTIIFSWMLTVACCLVAELGLYLVSGRLVAMHTYLHYTYRCHCHTAYCENYGRWKKNKKQPSALAFFVRLFLLCPGPRFELSTRCIIGRRAGWPSILSRCRINYWCDVAVARGCRCGNVRSRVSSVLLFGLVC